MQLLAKKYANPFMLGTPIILRVHSLGIPAYFCSPFPGENVDQFPGEFGENLSFWGDISLVK